MTISAWAIASQNPFNMSLNEARYLSNKVNYFNRIKYRFRDDESAASAVLNKFGTESKPLSDNTLKARFDAFKTNCQCNDSAASILVRAA